ncbi:MAG: HEAT repeat domain-containing protein, partial [Myxococcota bacterium]
PGRVRSWCRASRMLHVHHWCDSVVSFVHQLADIPDPQDHALLAILKDDPNPFVRLHALRLLNEPAVDEAHRNIALQKALDDPEPKLRCFAALRMNNDDALSELQGLAGGFDITEDIRLSAFEGLLKRKSGTDLVPLLVLAASGPEGRLSRRAMGWAIAYGGDEALRDIIGKPRIPLTGLTRALDAARRRKAMIVGPSLLTILSWEAASDDRRLLAVQGLGMLGTVQAVPILKKAADDDPAMAAAARASIAEIQARCKNATVGALSLAEADDGQLAIVEDVEEGTVALAEPGHAIPHDVRR